MPSLTAIVENILGVAPPSLTPFFACSAKPGRCMLHGVDSFPAYQIKSSWIHFEAQDGSTVHRHASGVTLEFLFNSVGIRLDENCFVFPDDRQFCTNEEFTLRYYVDGVQAESVNDLVFEDESRILISYGDNDLDRVDRELAELEDQPILS